ncbi:MAG: TRAP transporter small permease subunit [Alkalilacustris sp.]
MLDRAIRAVERVTDVAAFLGCLLLIPLILSMTYEVVARYAFNAPTFWAFEVSYMLMGSIFMLGMASALKHDQHVRVDFLFNAMPPRVRAGIDILCFLLVLPCAAWLAYELFNFAQRAYLSGRSTGRSAWNPVIWPYRAMLSVGFAVLTLQILVQIVKSARTIVTGRVHKGD